MKVLVIAQVAHLINLAYCAALGDTSQAAWEEAPEWQQKSAIAGVEMHLANPDATPEQSHESWLAEKVAAGWVYGEVKDAEKKQHPCCVPYADLPESQKAKDYLFRGVVHALKDIPDADDAAEAVTALQAELAELSAKLLIAQQSVATPGQVVTVAAVPDGYVAVKYIGHRPDWADRQYDTGLYFTEGQTRNLPAATAQLLLRHRDLFAQGEAVEAVATTTTAAPVDDTNALLEQAQKVNKDKQEEEIEFAVIDQVNAMTDKNTIADFAFNRFQLKVAKNTSIEVMRSKVVDHISRFGVV